MKRSFLGLLAGGLLLTGCGNDQGSPAQTTNAPAKPAANPSADPLSGMINAQQRAIKTVDTAALNKAVQLFNVQEGRNPKTLQELVDKKLIGEIPAAPNGMKLDYDPTTGDVKVTPK